MNFNCLICNKECSSYKVLLNGIVYHEDCYKILVKRIDENNDSINRFKYEIQQISLQIQQTQSFIGRLKKYLFSDTPNIPILQNRKEKLNKAIETITNEKIFYVDILEKMYDFWPTYPPDWDLRCSELKNEYLVCIQCGSSKSLHVHHKIPLSKGGNHTLNNLILLCEKHHKQVHKVEGFSYKEEDEISSFAKRLSVLTEAMKGEKIVHFSYTRRDGLESVRSISPKELIKVENALCITGYCYLRKEERTFSIKKIRGVKIVNEPGKCYHKEK